MRKEVKVGLALISLLLGVFSMVLYKRIQSRQAEKAQAVAAAKAGDAAPADATAMRPDMETRPASGASSLLSDAWSKPAHDATAKPSPAEPVSQAQIVSQQWQAAPEQNRASEPATAETRYRAAVDNASPPPLPPKQTFAAVESTPAVGAASPTPVDPISAMRGEVPRTTLANLPPGGAETAASDPFDAAGAAVGDRYAARPIPGEELDQPLPPSPRTEFAAGSAELGGVPPREVFSADPPLSGGPDRYSSEPPPATAAGLRGTPVASGNPVVSHGKGEAAFRDERYGAARENGPRDTPTTNDYGDLAVNTDRYGRYDREVGDDRGYGVEPDQSSPPRVGSTMTGRLVAQGRVAVAEEPAPAERQDLPPQRGPEPGERWSPDRRTPPATAQPYYDTRTGTPAAAAGHSAPAAAGSPPGEYIVQPGDSFWVISRKLYGDGGFFKALTEHNRRKYPQTKNLQVGDVVSTPPAEELRNAYPDLCPKLRQPLAGVHRPAGTQKMPGSRMYVVEDGDTLFDIARHQLGSPARWVEIYELNADRLSNDFDYIRPGTELLLPTQGLQRPRETVTGRPAPSPPR